MNFYAAHKRGLDPRCHNKGFYLRQAVSQYSYLIQSTFHGTLTRLAIASQVSPSIAQTGRASDLDDTGIERMLRVVEAERNRFLLKYEKFGKQRRQEKSQGINQVRQSDIHRLYAPDYFAPECERLLPWRDTDGKGTIRTGYLNEAGSWAFLLPFERADIFTEGFAPVQVAQKWGYITVAGEWHIAPQYTEIGFFLGGKAIVSNEVGWPKQHFEIDHNGQTTGKTWSSLELYSPTAK